MTKLRFSLRAHEFQTGLRSIQLAYEATILSLESRSATEQANRTEMSRAIAAREIDPYERDADGEILYSLEEEQFNRITESEKSIFIARQAFVLILHHYWERTCMKWMKIGEYKYDNAYKWLEAQGKLLDKTNLEILRKIANTIKHDSEKLFNDNSALFDNEILSSWLYPESKNYSYALQISSEQMLALFDAVKKSGFSAMPDDQEPLF